MQFKPRMKSSVKSIVPVHDVSCLKLDQMAIDLWQVEAAPGAEGEYISPDPRFVVFFDGATMAVDEDGEGSGATCSVLFVPAGMPLCGRLQSAGYLEHIDIHIDEAKLKRIADRSTELKSALFLSDSLELRRLCALLADECRRPERPHGYSEALACGVIHEIFHLGTHQQTSNEAPVWLEEVMIHAVENLYSQPTLKELATVAGMSRTQFCRRFKELAGVPPHQWVMGTRIKQAQRLLSEGALLSQVAHETGFSDQSHFTRCFLRATGMSPGRWTKRHVYSNR